MIRKIQSFMIKKKFALYADFAWYRELGTSTT